MQMENRKDPDYVDEESKFDCSVLSLNTLASLECFPLKAVRKERAERSGKRKYKEAKKKLSDSIENLLHVTLHDFDDSNVLMKELKENLQKIQLSEEKCRVLTLAPHSWQLKRLQISLVNQSIWLGRQKKSERTRVF